MRGDVLADGIRGDVLSSHQQTDGDPHGTGDWERMRVLHAGIAAGDAGDASGTHQMAARRLEAVVEAAEHQQTTVRIHRTHVARRVPAVMHLGALERWRKPVAIGVPRALPPDAAGFSWTSRSAWRLADRDSDPGHGSADRIGTEIIVALRHGDEAGFGRAVGGPQRDAEPMAKCG